MENYIKQLETENEELRQQLADTQYLLKEQINLNKIKLHWSGPCLITSGNTISYYLLYGKNMIIAQIDQCGNFYTGSCNGFHIASYTTLDEAKDAMMKFGFEEPEVVK